jgi:hypothetical protein
MLALHLANGIITARTQYTKKRDFFYKLTTTYPAEKVKEWYSMDRSTHIEKTGEIKSVYSHSASKGKFTVFDLASYHLTQS